MSHEQIKELIFKTIQNADSDATLIRDTRTLGNVYVDIVEKKEDKTVAVEIKTTNFFDGLGRAMIWKDYFDSIYLVIPRSILPHRQVLEKIPAEIGIIAYKLENNRVRFEIVRQANIALPTRLFEAPFMIEAKPYPIKPSRASLVSPKALRTVRYLLTHVKTSQKEIAKETQVSIGMVNKVISRLRERDIVAYKKRKLSLLEPWKLLNEVSWERPMAKLKIQDYYIPQLRDVKETEKYLNNVCGRYKTRYALTLFSGATRYVAYSMRYDAVYSYVEPSKSLLKFLARSQGRVGEGMRLELYRVDSSDVLDEAATIDDSVVCSPTQVLVDLSSYGYAGKDIAVKLYKELMTR